ncbi:ribonuclease H-like domain-containing protein [Haematococcus lacustris]
MQCQEMLIARAAHVFRQLKAMSKRCEQLGTIRRSQRFAAATATESHGLVSSEETAVKDAPTALEKKKKASGARKRAAVTLLADATTALPTAGGLVVAAVETKEAEHASAKLEMAVVPAAKRQTSTKNGATREREQQLWAKGYTHVIGVDEAGRGPLAGPVVAAACVLPPGVDIPGINDSKQVDEASRERLYEAITGTPGVMWAVCEVDNVVIDRLNILQATMSAMRGAVDKLGLYPASEAQQCATPPLAAPQTQRKTRGRKGKAPVQAAQEEAAVEVHPPPSKSCNYLLVDGNRLPKDLPLSLHGHAEAVVKGDAQVLCIAAASIIAKVTRDRIMLAYHDMYPEFNFKQHKAYGVPEHLEALRRHQPCIIHRRSFEPVKSMTGWSRAAQLAEEAAASVAATSTVTNPPQVT